MRISDWSSDVCSSDLAPREVCRPGGDMRFELFPIASEQGAAGFLKAWAVAGQWGHDPIKRVAGWSGSVFFPDDRFLHQTPQRGRCAATLLGQPFPVAWQESAFPRLHTPFGAARSGGHRNSTLYAMLRNKLRSEEHKS